MGINKFINRVKELLELDEFEKAGKKKSVKRLLEKLRARERELNEALSKKHRKKEAKELKEELSIVTVQIKKGEKILKELNEE
jgi:DNA-binding transcriptional regulator GbsR (MarR family)